ncbi:MAG: hypothetical protein FWH49_01885 [Clostridiales bacterium]|nr:hypothetical protein [Clostridiales bacterium]
MQLVRVSKDCFDARTGYSCYNQIGNCPSNFFIWGDESMSDKAKKITAALMLIGMIILVFNNVSQSNRLKNLELSLGGMNANYAQWRNGR